MPPPRSRTPALAGALVGGDSSRNAKPVDLRAPRSRLARSHRARQPRTCPRLGSRRRHGPSPSGTSGTPWARLRRPRSESRGGPSHEPPTDPAGPSNRYSAARSVHGRQPWSRTTRSGRGPRSRVRPCVSRTQHAGLDDSALLEMLRTADGGEPMRRLLGELQALVDSAARSRGAVPSCISRRSPRRVC